MVNIEKLHVGRIGDLNKMFSIYLNYIDNVDISMGVEIGDLAHLRKYRVREACAVGGCPLATLEAPATTLVEDPTMGPTTITTPSK